MIKCAVCNHEDEEKKWINIDARGNDGYSKIEASTYDDEKGWINLWYLKLLACPKCGTVKVNI